MKTAVIIATRNEPDLQATMDNIRANSNADVIAVEDEQGLGPQAMRHRGVVEAVGADVVIIMDGHMRVKPGSLDAIAAEVAAGHHVVCARCNHNHVPWEGATYSAAKVCWKSEEFGNQHWVLSGKWRETPDPGPIGCVMGACYAFSRDWYMDGIGAPWQFGAGWGCDEELLSISTWLAGGESWLSPEVVWHRARSQDDVPYNLTIKQQAGVWANRLMMLDMLPMSHDDRAELSEWIYRNELGNLWGIILDICRNREDEISLYRTRLAARANAAGRTWDDWKDTWMDKETRPMHMYELRRRAKCAGVRVKRSDTAADLERKLLAKSRSKPSKRMPTITTTTTLLPPPQVIVERVPVRRCDRCDEPDPFRPVTGPRRQPFGDVHYGKCKRCGHKMQVQYIRD